MFVSVEILAFKDSFLSCFSHNVVPEKASPKYSTKCLLFPLFLASTFEIASFSASFWLISSCINCSASAVYSDNFTGTDTTVSYSGMQPGFVLSGSNEICAKSLSSYAFATYKLNDANSVSATFYTPIYPTATQTGDVTVLGSMDGTQSPVIN